MSEAGSEPLAERWNGRKWVIRRTPDRAAARVSSLSGVSCVSATACTAVGSSFGRRIAVFTTLAERWNGTRWVIQHTRDRHITGFIESSLAGVSCMSATSCVAVGPLALLRHGARWTIKRVVVPDSRGVTLAAGSCTSARACTAVGSYFDLISRAYLTLAERWNGIRWAVQLTPSPPSIGPDLLGVSCASATACTAAGRYYDGSLFENVPLAEAWNGTAWAIQPTPDISSDGNGSLNAVSCRSATACWAVGSSESLGTLVERYS